MNEASGEVPRMLHHQIAILEKEKSALSSTCSFQEHCAYVDPIVEKLFFHSFISQEKEGDDGVEHDMYAENNAHGIYSTDWLRF